MTTERYTVDKKELTDIINSIFDARRSIDEETHHDHHAWIRERIAAEKARKEVYREVAKSVAQWSVIGILAMGLSYCGINYDSLTNHNIANKK